MVVFRAYERAFRYDMKESYTANSKRKYSLEKDYDIEIHIVCGDPKIASAMERRKN